VISVGSVFDPIGNRAKPLGDGVVAYYALAGDIFVARAVLRLDPDCISEVRLIEGELGRPLRPSRIRSKAGRAFWASRYR